MYIMYIYRERERESERERETAWEARKRQVEAAERKVVLIAVMAVHMATRERLERLRHVLRSVQEQTGLPANTELVVAISWFSPTPEMAVQVEEVLEGFAATRSARAQAAPPAALAQGCPEIKVHSHEAQPRSQPRSLKTAGDNRTSL